MPSTASAVVLPVLLLVVGLGLGAVLGYAITNHVVDSVWPAINEKK